MRCLITTKIIVLNAWCACYYCVFLGHYEFSPYTVYPVQDLNHKRRPKPKLCRVATCRWAQHPPPLSTFKYQARNLPHERDIEKYRLYFRLDSHNLNSANYKQSYDRPIWVCVHFKSRSEDRSQKITHNGAIIKLETLDEFVKDNGSASYCQLKRLL